MNKPTQSVTLESLLSITPELDNSPVLSIVDAVMECADVMQEIAVIEQNITTYEAAKLVKKAKSASKKVKTKKTKMTAKDAKAKKAGGKVVKITKAKKVVREGEELIDGGTGPLPTTSDTNGLTDTDLDAAPDAEVEVTEIVEDGTPAEEIVGTEGADFIVMYEDADIVRFEAEEVAQKKALGEKIKEFAKRVADFIKSIVAKVIEFFNFDKKYFDKNKAAIAKGLGMDATVKILKLNGSPNDLSFKMYGDAKKIIDAIKSNIHGDTSDTEAVSRLSNGTDSILGVNIGNKEAGGAEVIRKQFFVSDEVVEMKLSESKWTISDIEAILIESQKAWKDLKKSIDNQTAKLMKSIDDTMRNRIISGPEMYKIVGTCFGIYSKLRGQASKVMHAAGKAGGGEAAPAEEPK